MTKSKLESLREGLIDLRNECLHFGNFSIETSLLDIIIHWLWLKIEDQRIKEE